MDTDVGTDTDAENDTDAEGDTDAENDTDAESELDTDVDTDTDAEADAEEEGVCVDTREYTELCVGFGEEVLESAMTVLDNARTIAIARSITLILLDIYISKPLRLTIQ